MTNWGEYIRAYACYVFKRHRRGCHEKNSRAAYRRAYFFDYYYPYSLAGYLHDLEIPFRNKAYF